MRGGNENPKQYRLPFNLYNSSEQAIIPQKMSTHKSGQHLRAADSPKLVVTLSSEV